MTTDQQITAAARSAYRASFDATSDRGCAEDAAREEIARLSTGPGEWDGESQTWTSDAEPGEAAAALANGDARDVACLLCKRMGWGQWGNPSITATAYDIDGGEVIVTSGTGEGTFAYDPEEVAAWLDSVDWDAVENAVPSEDDTGDGVGSYTDFCDGVGAIFVRATALYLLIAHDVEIHAPGACNSVLGGDVETIRKAIAAR